MLPLVTRAALEVIHIVPGSLREAALALGAPQWKVVLRVVLPTARVGLITAAILGVARTAGETAEVLFTAGGNSHYNWNPVKGYQDDLPLRIYNLIFQPSVNAIREAWGVAFVLVAVVLGLFATARVVGALGAGRSPEDRGEGPGASVETLSRHGGAGLCSRLGGRAIPMTTKEPHLMTLPPLSGGDG